MEFVYQMIAQALDRIAAADASLVAITTRTLLFAVVSTAIALLIGLPLGVWLGSARTRGRRAGLVVANAGLGLPPVVLGIYVAIALSPGSPLAGLRWINTLQGVILSQVLLALPIVAALTGAAVRGLPAGLLDQARAFGAPTFARGVLALREARIGVIAAITAALLSALAEVGAVVIVGGNLGGKTTTLASTVLLALSASDPATATAVVIVLVALVLVVGGGMTLVQQRAR